VTIRLNKLLAARGVGSRRHCDALIAAGRVRVNGRVVNEAGTRVEESARLEVDGRAVEGRQRHVYFVLNKPVGVITTLDDPQGRRTVRELLPRGARVYPVGRLDADTSGLLLLTNDGELAHKLMHPRYGVEKTYRVRLASEPSRAQLERLARGVEFERGQVSAPARARRIDPGFDAIMIEIGIHEGRHRQVRKMCEAVGLEVTGLHRVGYGPLRLGPLARGMFRELSEDELARLRAAAARPVRAGRRPPTRPVATPPRRPLTSQPPIQPRRPLPSRAPKPPRPPRSGPAREEEAEIDDVWLPGGAGPRESAERAPAPSRSWPARADERRGDVDAPRSRERVRGEPRPGRRTPRARPRADSRAPERRGIRPDRGRPVGREGQSRPRAGGRRAGPVRSGGRREGRGRRRRN